MNNPQIVRHGEVLLKPIEELPKDAKLVKEDKEIVVAHSETGHHHIVRTLDRETGANVRIYELDGRSYLAIGSQAELYHQKTGTDVHTPHILDYPVYEIVIKQNYDYFAKKMLAVRD